MGLFIKFECFSYYIRLTQILALMHLNFLPFHIRVILLDREGEHQGEVCSHFFFFLHVIILNLSPRLLDLSDFRASY